MAHAGPQLAYEHIEAKLAQVHQARLTRPGTTGSMEERCRIMLELADEFEV